MGKAACFFAALLLSLVLLAASPRAADARRLRDPAMLGTTLAWVPATVIGDLSESACTAANETDNMYVAIPAKEFGNGRACNKKIRVSCAEPFGDLGGPWAICRSRKIITLTVIDQVVDEPLDDDLFRLSLHAFSQMAHPDVGLIRLLIRR